MTPLARDIRRHCLTMAHRTQSSHLASCLSAADILADLYGGIMRVRPEEPDWPDRDRLIVSCGHKAMAVYAALAEVGFFPVGRLAEYPKHPFEGHVCRDVPGVEWSTGSLGHGLPVAVGIAMARPDVRVFCLLSDGDMEEGSTLEAIAVAGECKLRNLVAVVDANGWTATKRTNNKAFVDYELLFHDAEWDIDIWPQFWFEHFDGHNPIVRIYHTKKGAGISFMEDSNEFHYRAPNGEEYKRALLELEGVQ